MVWRLYTTRAGEGTPVGMGTVCKGCLCLYQTWGRTLQNGCGDFFQRGFWTAADGWLELYPNSAGAYQRGLFLIPPDVCNVHIGVWGRYSLWVGSCTHRGVGNVSTEVGTLSTVVVGIVPIGSGEYTQPG
jgi:hypothetical protein